MTTTLISAAMIAVSLQQLPLWNGSRFEGDWLIARPPHKAGAFRTPDDELVLANGLISRTFSLKPGLATVALDNLGDRISLLRAVRPEAMLTIDGKDIAVGGLEGQPNQAFLLPEWISSLTPTKSPLTFKRFEVAKPEKRLDWKRVRHASELPWPPPGVRLSLHFESVDPPLHVVVNYELYDGIPLLSKWVTVQNQGSKPIRLNRFTSEILAAVEPESIVEDSAEWQRPNLTVLTDYAFGGMAATGSNRTVHWEVDKSYASQVNYNLNTPCLLHVRPPLGPETDIAAGATFETFRTFELVHDSNERERKGLALRRMYRTIAPWCTENPIMLHLTSVDPAVVHRAIDQASECGFEMIVISFWSGLDMEDQSAANLAKFKEFRSYANSKGVELGGYSLLASRSIDKESDVVNPKPAFGSSPCLCSKWGQEYFVKLETFFNATGFNLLEHDGSYPGDTCASTTHPGHRAIEDSQWKQYEAISSFYKRCRAQGIYLNVPDNYFLVGSNKTAMGYRESNWSLPRTQQHIHCRQNLFDGTWEKTPSMGWMMTPLVEYQGGGTGATIEPLSEHLVDYEQHLANNFGYGVQSCYRGPRLYDTAETKAVVQKWVNWFKMYREILESDVVHLRRADGKNLDGILHVNPFGSIRGMAVIYNPTSRVLEQEIELPLYYSGLSGSCSLAFEDARARRETLDSLGRTRVRVKVDPMSRRWIVVRK